MRHRPPGASRAAHDTGSLARDASSAARPAGSATQGTGSAAPTARGPGHDVIRVLPASAEAALALQSDLGTLRGAELILACGYLPPDYLSHLMDALDLPLVFVPGNHDADMSG